MHPRPLKSNPSFKRANGPTLPSLQKVRNESEVNLSPSTNSQKSAVSSLSPITTSSSRYPHRIASAVSNVSTEGEPSPKKSPAHSPIIENDGEFTYLHVRRGKSGEDMSGVEKMRTKTMSNFSEELEEARGRN